MTYPTLEARSLHLSRMGLRLRLSELPEGWGWEWALGDQVIESGETDARTKSVALHLATCLPIV